MKYASIINGNMRSFFPDQKKERKSKNTGSKYTLNMFILLLIGMSVIAQTPADKLFAKYENLDGVSTVYISSYMFNLFSNFSENDADAKEVKEVTDQLEEIKILNIEDVKLNASLDFYKEIEKQLPMNEYKVLMSIKETNQVTKFMVREKGNKITELLMISGGATNSLMIIKGVIDIKTISKLSQSMDIEGLDKLEEME